MYAMRGYYSAVGELDHRANEVSGPLGAVDIDRVQDLVAGIR